ncbi:MAG: hypothetical protein J6V12_00060 [Bacteroidaceae bacterium]|nr:hypothetical protein [Bacteroidaceae bacterium]
MTQLLHKALLSLFNQSSHSVDASMGDTQSARSTEVLALSANKVCDNLLMLYHLPRFTNLVKVVRLDEIRVLFIFAIKAMTMTRDMRNQHTTTQGEYCRVRKVTMLKTSEEVKRARIRKIYLHKVLDCHTTK